MGNVGLARTQPTLLDLGVAVAAGAIGAYARLRTDISATLAGTAIAVALMPPLCTVGIGVAHLDISLVWGAALLFLTNLLGILFAAMLVYAAEGLAHAEQSRKHLLWTGALMVLVTVPLAISFTHLLVQSRLQQALRAALTGGTVTFQRAQLVQTDFDWRTVPARVTLLVRSQTPITPAQVRDLEAFAERRTGTAFHFIVDVVESTRVTAPASPSPSPGATNP
jgi:uncharacterized membrane protein